MFHLEDLLVEASLLGEHFELPGVRVLVDLEVRLHDPKLVVLEGGPGALGLGLGQAVTVQAGRVALYKRGRLVILYKGIVAPILHMLC
jgi:hypothetical protein